MSVKEFLRHHYRHFNAAVVIDASEGWVEHLKNDGNMMVTLAGAMSSAELGLSLAELIRTDRVHAISCTGANLEEDLFNLVAHTHYRRVPNYRDLTPADEVALLEAGMNRVTDTCIPEEVAFRKVQKVLQPYWIEADQEGIRRLPHEYLYQALNDGAFESEYDIDPAHSWLLAAAQKNIPLYVPGWEDSTLGNGFVAMQRTGLIKNLDTVLSGLHYMNHLIDWYVETSAKHSIGFFQIGGGIAGDFAICVVPLINQDLVKDIEFNPTGIDPVPLWGYFCQISDSTTSYGSYSGAVPNEKITWGKVGPETPTFVIESDATIVAPLVFQYLLES